MQAHDLKEPQRIHALYSENVATTIDTQICPHTHIFFIIYCLFTFMNTDWQYIFSNESVYFHQYSNSYFL